MNPQQIIDRAKAKFEQSVSHFGEEMKKLRTGRAHTGMLDGVLVMAYGTPMPLVQVGTVTAPEAQLLQITPFDPNNLQAIVSAIRDNPSLGLNPMDDGRVVRIPIPPLNEERRREFVKLLSGKVENCMIALRNTRHEALKEIGTAKKDKEIGNDDAVKLEKQLNEALNVAKDKVENIASSKEQEIMTL